MKKLGLISIICIICIVPMFFEVNAATPQTIKDLKDELASFKKQAAENASKKQLTKAEINEKNNSISAAYNEQEVNLQKVEEAKQKVIESEAKIEDVTEETNDLFRFFQISSGENAYLSYIADADSITDLIVRTAVTEQLSAYNNEKLNNLKQLVTENKQLQEDLANRNKELDSSINAYKNKIVSLGVYLGQLDEFSLSISEQIKTREDMIKTYTDLGCKDNHTIDQCMRMVSDSTMIRPLVKGRVSSTFGPRGSGMHSAVDLAGNPEGTPVYSVANGTVAYVTRYQCGGNTVFINHNVAGKAYTSTYAHLLTINVKQGQAVSSQTQIGSVGGGSTASYDRCTAGAHLHYVIANGYFTSWERFSANLTMPPNITNKVGWTFNTRI